LPKENLSIGILSDTHGYYHPELDEVLRDVDLILHAGDVGKDEILDKLEAIAPTIGVYGNVDGRAIRIRLKEQERVRLGPLNCFLIHIGGKPERWASGVGAVLREELPDVFVCGHSHILRIERVRSLNGMLFINPGAAGREGFHQVQTCVRLFIADGAAQKAEVVHLGR
jgi:uncharacterized protein